MSDFKSVLDNQHGGTHYKEKGIQPIAYAHANDLSFFQGNVVKYVTRYKDKKGVEDVKKAIHYLQMILEFEYGVFSEVSFSDAEELSETYKNPFSGSDISQEELKSFIESVDNLSSQEELWYPPVHYGTSFWVEWREGRMPDLDPELNVSLLLQCERDVKNTNIANEREPVGGISWENGGDKYDIVAYRIVD